MLKLWKLSKHLLIFATKKVQIFLIFFTVHSSSHELELGLTES